jgi:hypothetical protein
MQLATGLADDQHLDVNLGPKPFSSILLSSWKVSHTDRLSIKTYHSADFHDHCGPVLVVASSGGSFWGKLS